MAQVLRILAAPGLFAKKDNPYTWSLYSSMQGVSVEDFSYVKALCRHYDIVHFHWPDGILNYSPSNLKTSLRVIREVAIYCYLWLRGTKIVWTVHNLQAHEQWHPYIEKWYFALFTRLVHGCITLTSHGMLEARRKYARLAKVPFAVIPHGHYRDTSAVLAEDARATFGISPEASVILYLGRIRPYKNVPKLISVFKRIHDKGWMLVIAGQPKTESMRKEIEEEANGDSRIELILSFLSDQQTSQYLQAADLVVLPYRESLNSGVALLALSMNKPILVPNIGSFVELAEMCGTDWVRTYDGELKEAVLSEAVIWAKKGERASTVSLDDLAWPRLADQTVEFYRSLDMCISQ